MSFSRFSCPSPLGYPICQEWLSATTVSASLIPLSVLYWRWKVKPILSRMRKKFEKINTNPSNLTPLQSISFALYLLNIAGKLQAVAGELWDHRTAKLTAASVIHPESIFLKKCRTSTREDVLLITCIYLNARAVLSVSHAQTISPFYFVVATLVMYIVSALIR